MDPTSIAASLWSSFRRIPPAAIPTMLDCMLTSSTAASSSSSIFSALLNQFPNLVKEIAERSEKLGFEGRNCVVSYVAALSHLFKKSGGHQMPVFIWKIWIPVLKLVHTCDRELFNEVASLFLDVVSETNTWEVLETTAVPLLLRSIGLSVGMSQSDEFAIYRWSSISTAKEPNDEELSPVSFDNFHDQLIEMKYEDYAASPESGLPLPVSCNILTLTLDAALYNMHEGDACCSTLENTCQSRNLAGNILWDLSNLALQMLSTSLEHRSMAIRFLLPCVFKAFLRENTFRTSVDGIHHVLTRSEYFTKVWQCCKLLFSLGSLERRDAYDILSLYLSFSSPSDDCMDVNVCGSDSLVTDPKFWVEMKRGLLDKESLVRKQSLDILKTTLNLSKETKCSDDNGSDPRMMSKKGKWADDEAKSLGIGKFHTHSESTNTGQQRWETFVFLYEMLEEYGTHLVEAAWNHQIMLWLQSSFTIDSSVFVNGEINCTWMDTPMQVFEWLAVLWERGFSHDNPQVRCHIMQSFLATEWEKYGGCGTLVPKDFILGPLVRGLNDPVHHREFGLKEVYSSWTIKAAAKFLGQYTSSMERRHHISFMVNFASIPKTHSLGRVGLMCLAECIRSATSGLLEQNNCETEQCIDTIAKETLNESAHDFIQNAKSDLLDVLRFVIECSKQHFNPRYRYKVCENIVAAATTMMTAIDIPLEILLNFMSCLPREYTDYGGSLRHAVQKWLCGTNSHLLKVICEFPTKFISSQHPLDCPVTYNDEELDAWVSEVKRWIRVLFLVAKEEEDFYPIIKFLQDHGGDISKQNSSPERLDVKFLILVSSLVQELQVILEKTCKSEMTSKTSNPLLPVMPDNLTLREPIICEKFTTVMLSFMEELVLCAKLASSIFWVALETEEKTLPGSIRGRLGGPSQRRLPSSLCTSVLKAITALKTLASVSRWCAQFRADVLLNHSQTFLWNFCWKIIRSPTCKSEVEAELCIAAHESCAYVLKDLAPIFSSLPSDIYVNNDNSFPVETESEALLDIFVTTFMHNINNVIDGGILARTRRAVLMNWKWTCLESLLRLPNYALCNGGDLKSCRFYFSYKIVRQIFDDLVGSLEQAGEVSILPMLRSVRLCSGHLAPKRTNPESFSCEGITIQMMWLLVRSSWILHANCNKRRVAPIAALLSCVLNTSVFGDDSMHELNGAPGPLKWFIEKILEEGTKSPRTIRLAALHLSGLWLAHPNILKYYMKELKLLTFYGSVAFDEDFEAEVAENTDARTEVSLLSRSLDPELTEVFINTELYGRVSVAVLFSKLADMTDVVKSTPETENTSAAITSGKMFLSELLDSVVNDKDLSKELYKKYSAIHRRKVRAWQMICVLSRFVDIDIVEQVTSSLHTSLYRNNLPSVRQYLETFAIHIYLKFPLLIGKQLVNFLRSYELRPQALSSYVFIAANVILNSEEESRYGHLNELLPPIIPLLTSHHHTLRGFTQILVYKVLQRMLPELKSDTCAGVSLEKKCFVELASYLEHNSDCARLRTSMDSYLDVFDPVNSISPAGIFVNRVEDVDFECVQTTLMDRVNDFLNNAREDLRSSMAKDAAAIKNESIHIDKSNCSGNMDSNGGASVNQVAQEISYDFQKKITFSKLEIQDSASTISSDDQAYKSLADMETEDQLLNQLLRSRGMIVEKLKASRQKIVILASLIDRIPNLAGLARTCEVFRAAGLAVADKNILNDKQFQLISVTAEKWVPVMEVPVASMKVFLEKKKQHGYAILGLEQTANSIPLDEFKFPTKTVLVLGREKEGIPVEIIHMLDGCIEIPQLGIVRSLNVHVSGAIALWEYTRQQRLLQ